MFVGPTSLMECKKQSITAQGYDQTTTVYPVSRFSLVGENVSK